MVFLSDKEARASSLEHSRTPGSRRALRGAAIGMLTVAATAAVDHRRGSPPQQPPTVIERAGNGDAAFYVLPGCRTVVTDHTVDMFKGALNPDDTLRVFNYGHGTPFQLGPLQELLIESREKDVNKDVYLVLLSMGGRAIMKSYQNPEFRDNFATCKAAVFDSCPTGSEDLTEATRKHIKLVNRLGNSASAAAIARRLLLQQDFDPTQHDEAVTDEQVRLQHVLNSGMPPATIRSQIEMIEEPDEPETGFLVGLSERSIYVSAQQDHVVDVARAHSVLKDDHDGRMDWLIDDGRPAVSHALGLRYPRWLLKQLTGDPTRVS